MAAKTIRNMSAAVFRRKLNALEKALHRAAIHPRYKLYFVRVGKQPYTLSGEAINLKASLEGRGLSKKPVTLKIGQRMISAFNKVKTVYALANYDDVFGIEAQQNTMAYFNELLDHALTHRVAPGYQYGNFFINPADRTFGTPSLEHVSEWKKFPWRISNVQASDRVLSVNVYRPTPARAINGLVSSTQYNTHYGRLDAIPHEPVTVRMVGHTELHGQHRHIEILPTVVETPLVEDSHWLIIGSAISFNLRLPTNLI